MKTTFVLGVDPGINGAIVLTDGKKLKTWPIPLKEEGKNKFVDFDAFHSILHDQVLEKHGPIHVFVERAVPFALGTSSAFTYGRNFEALLIAIRLLSFPMSLVEASKWTKEMHEGISADFKPKKKSLIAIGRLYPHLVGSMPKDTKTGKKLKDGPVDALLIAGYGLRKHFNKAAKSITKDFF